MYACAIVIDMYGFALKWCLIERLKKRGRENKWQSRFSLSVDVKYDDEL